MNGYGFQQTYLTTLLLHPRCFVWGFPSHCAGGSKDKSVQYRSYIWDITSYCISQALDYYYTRPRTRACDITITYFTYIYTVCMCMSITYDISGAIARWLLSGRSFLQGWQVFWNCFCSVSHYACVRLCAYVCPPFRLLWTICVKWSLNNWLKNFYCFSVFFMTHSIDIIDGHGLSNKTRCESLPKKTKVTLY